MTEKEKQQILTIIKNIKETKNNIPFFTTLQSHKTFGVFFQGIEESKQKEISDLIDEYIVDYISGLKTKGGQYFQRFFETEKDLFWEFRKLNENVETDSNLSKSKNFQDVGQKIETKMFELEGVLTQNMFNRTEGLDKVIDAFYNIVYCVFPHYNSIE